MPPTATLGAVWRHLGRNQQRYMCTRPSRKPATSPEWALRWWGAGDIFLLPNALLCTNVIRGHASSRRSQSDVQECACVCARCVCTRVARPGCVSGSSSRHGLTQQTSRSPRPVPRPGGVLFPDSRSWDAFRKEEGGGGGRRPPAGPGAWDAESTALTSQEAAAGGRSGGRSPVKGAEATARGRSGGRSPGEGAEAAAGGRELALPFVTTDQRSRARQSLGQRPPLQCRWRNRGREGTKRAPGEGHEGRAQATPLPCPCPQGSRLFRVRPRNESGVSPALRETGSRSIY